jgi:alcohol dehydrogenase class IV
VRRLFLVSDASLPFLKIRGYFEDLDRRLPVVRFDDFQPNPLYGSVEKGVSLFREEACDAIIAVGGGSAMDVAKCIKLYSNMDSSRNYLRQEIVPNTIPFLAVPTTAGTGSESTRYAVIYYGGEKQSVTHESCIPGTVLLDSSALKTLPLYQKKSTMLDALCHAIESCWSVNSTEESREYSRAAIHSILSNMGGYLANDDRSNAEMLLAANTAGKAINITQTTAGHAMCYKVTSLFGVAHGHAAALCDRKLFPWMIRHPDRTIDSRGPEFVQGILDEIGRAMGCADAAAGAERLEKIFNSLELAVPEASAEQFALLKTSVNPVRLKNHPIALDEETIDRLYHEILREAGEDEGNER